MRAPERLLIGYFTYVAVIGSWFFSAWNPWLVAAVVTAIVLALTRAQSIVRDIAPLPFMLVAYREMNWFTPAVRDHHLEKLWIVWDRWLLNDYHLRAAIEAVGALFPSYLELCYVLVYAVGPVCLAALFWSGRRDEISRFWFAYLAGTLGAYALLPFFPSEPPRTVFASADLPQVVTLLRRFNLWILGGYGIHSSVFPSAHVSSAFSAAWGLLATIPEKKWIGWLMTGYAISVAVATVYGRYHYAADAAAGLAVSLLAVAALKLRVGA